MSRSVRVKMVLCPVVLVAMAVVPPLVLQTTPWPIPRHVRRSIYSPWYLTVRAEQIYVAKVVDVGGFFTRVAVLDVLEVIKGEPLPSRIESPVGRIAGSDDKGETLLVFERRAGVQNQRLWHRGWRPSTCKVGHAGKPIDVPVRVPGWQAEAKLPGDEAIDVVRLLVLVESAGKESSQEGVPIPERYLSWDRGISYHLIRNSVCDHLRRRRAGPAWDELYRRFGCE